MSQPTHYKVLEITPTATPQQIREAYRLLALVWHPNRLSAGSKNLHAIDKMKAINTAYEVLINPQSRANYDKTLAPQRQTEVLSPSLSSASPSSASPLSPPKPAGVGATTANGNQKCHCPYCASPVGINAHFCGRCGKSIASPSIPPPSIPPTGASQTLMQQDFDAALKNAHSVPPSQQVPLKPLEFVTPPLFSESNVPYLLTFGAVAGLFFPHLGGWFLTAYCIWKLLTRPQGGA